MTVSKNDIHYETAYVVRVSRTQRALKIAAVVLIAIVLPLGSFLLTQWYTGKEARRLADLVEQQDQRVTDLRLEIESLEQQKANAVLSSEIDRSSMEQLRKEIVASQDRIQVLNQQIRFYQSLMDPNPDKGGVYLESVDIKPATVSGEYVYNIIVAQRSSNHRRVSGSVDLQLIGRGEGEVDQTISLAELTENQDRLPLGFKFFQQLDGSIRLPEGFVPARVRVMVQIDGNDAPRVEETYEWNS